MTVDSFIAHVFTEVIGPWTGSLVVLVLLILLTALAGMTSSLGGCTSRLVAA